MHPPSDPRHTVQSQAIFRGQMLNTPEPTNNLFQPTTVVASLAPSVVHNKQSSTEFDNDISQCRVYQALFMVRHDLFDTCRTSNGVGAPSILLSTWCQSGCTGFPFVAKVFSSIIPSEL